MIRTAELARIMHNTNPEYRVYEYNDMLTVLTNTLVTLAVQGEVVQLRNFGTFYQYQTKPRVVFDPILLHTNNMMVISCSNSNLHEQFRIELRQLSNKKGNKHESLGTVVY